MLVKSVIKDVVPPLKSTDTVGRAINWMEEFRHSQLPVISDVGYIGVVTERDLRLVENLEETIASSAIPINRLFVYDNQHIFDAVKLAANNHFSVVPVLNEAEQYIGLLTITDIIEAFAASNSVQNPGGIIVLEVDKKDYSLSEISRLVEYEGAHVLSSSAIITDDPEQIEVTLKVNKIDLTRILAAFYRHNMDVKASYQQSESQKDIQLRYDAFMNYLGM
jgi:acetoin utilization protein AcuB